MNLRVASDLTFDSIVDGPGLRAVLWTQGCVHGCKGCHNPETWDVNGGKIVDTNDIIESIKASKLQSGLTISGGDPFLQPEPILEIVKEISKIPLSIWIYTGYTYEQLLKDPKKADILNYVDVLVDGKFEEDKKSYKLLFCGSSNQRLIDVKKTKEANEIILWKSDYSIEIE
ncbi:anaerobic ribonucleoside-triphosphate reductase activating protein [Breznakia pachnodae]|uniref:Anaerobic ribonucleoside-triphosphate reductase-activating protein n=1 Tax=Breznakia pachnodae TaxID=265178 RepID=A0ABU0E259_9FIRM|nr:anaerobic ribonucleoside-triphosphate reductase activating protein [Breznakia pachnodae]MDQ0360974.1 anaerobic ribonucleoside-triphosphate reductase activating protein [Breznakia pachnodae]